MERTCPKVYAVRHLNEVVRANSRSGGIFTALSDFVLSQKGIVYGCAFDSDFNAVHIRAVNATERDLMRGSKYVQSKLGNTFRTVKKDLEEGKMVLFSGTSCQVSGLRKFLRKNYNNLICVDIVCYGVPSRKVWNSYIKWREEKQNSKIKSVSFRNKSDFGWRAHIETLSFDNGKTIDSQVFQKLFYGHCILRPSCYQCHYKSIMHPGDITIADYWGIENAAPEFDDNKGVSLVLVNTDCGDQVFDIVKADIKWKETRIADSMQPPLERAFPAPENRTVFWKDYNQQDFEFVAKKYGQAGIIDSLKQLLKRVKRKFL